MIDEVYNTKILELAGNIPMTGQLSDADASARAHSRLCGSTVNVDLKLTDGRVSDFAHVVRACALGQASSSIMARTIIGSTPEELRSVRQDMLAMLKDGKPAPDGRWSDLRFLEPVREYKARHASTMLTFDAVVDALDQIEAGKAGQTDGAAV
ncbi:MAG: iron-sulfur cluster assembly scaffold protein [Alphaproteobacteria bacterium]